MAMSDLEPPNLDGQIVTFIGPEGAGKSKLAGKLAHDTQKPYISTGDIIRNLSQNDPGRLGEICREMFAGNTYLDPSLLLEILASRLSKEDTAIGFVLDGGLRTLDETKKFPSMLAEIDRDLPMTVVQLRIPAWMSIDRLVFAPGARRRDQGDTVEGVRSRLAKYNLNLNERVALITQQPKWNLVRLSTTGTMAESYPKLCAALHIKASKNTPEII